ncbi:MAG: DnaD domain protein [Clostridia bacterium]|nr:DnaD domain protein [Clostridia bacterium]
MEKQQKEESAPVLFQFDDRYALFDMTPVDNQFIQEYLPAARGEDVRVYLYGLMRCYHPEAEMSLAQMSRELHLEEEEIARAYRYWERKGLVRRVSDDPPAYRYISARQRAMGGAEPQLDPEYEAFADSLYGVFDHGRRLHGSEIRTCYEWVEDLKLPPEAVIMLLKHMERNKGKNFAIQSAQQVAMQMAKEGVQTVEEAEDFLSRDQALYQGTKAVLKRLGKRNLPSEDQLALYKKWTQEWGFTPEAIQEACAETAKGDPSMGFLDGVLRNIRERSASGARIEASGVVQAREEGAELRRVLKTLGSGSVTERHLEWYRKVREVYPEDMVLLAARECGRSGGSVEDVEKMLDSWSRKGIFSTAEAEKYVQEFRAQGELMMELRKMWGLKNRMSAKDRALVAEWEKELGFAPELILLAAEGASGADKPMAYLNKILRDYAEKGIRTKEQILLDREQHQAAKPAATAPGTRAAKQVIAQQYSQRDYSGPEESMEEVLMRLEGEKDSRA